MILMAFFAVWTVVLGAFSLYLIITAVVGLLRKGKDDG